jgi:hypothetical protein
MSPSDLAKLWKEPTKNGHIFNKVLQKSKFSKKKLLMKVGFLVQYSSQKTDWKDSTNFQHWKMTLKIRILRCSRRLFIILVSLTVTLFSEKMLISTRCIHGFMPNSIKTSVTVSIVYRLRRHWRSTLHCMSIGNIVHWICFDSARERKELCYSGM